METCYRNYNQFPAHFISITHVFDWIKSTFFINFSPFSIPGLILKHNKKYSQTVKKAFHLSAASLDTSQVKAGEDIQILLNSDDNVFLLGTLNKDKIPQCNLDLNFAEGDKICFSIKGEGIVHLTGFLIPDAEDDFMEDEEDDEEELVESNKKNAAAGKKDKKAGKLNALEKLIAKDADDSDSDEMDDTFDPEKPVVDDDSSDEEENGAEVADDDDDDEDEVSLFS